MGKVYRGDVYLTFIAMSRSSLRPELMAKDQIVNRFRSEALSCSKAESSPYRDVIVFCHEENFRHWRLSSCAANASTGA